jgi:NitT/TauT family transport system permease protein
MTSGRADESGMTTADEIQASTATPEPTFEPVPPADAIPLVDPADVFKVFLRRKRRARIGIIVSWFVLTAALIGLWQLSSGRWTKVFYVSSPSLVGHRIGAWIQDGSIWPNLGTSLLETVLGFGLGAGAALVIGLLLGRFPIVSEVLSPLLTAAYALPKIILGPLLILYFGLGLQMKYVLGAIVTFFIVFYTTEAAVRNVDRDLIAVVRFAGGGELAVIRKVYFPSALGGILSGVRLAIPMTFQAVLFAEILASNKGLGFVVQQSSGTFDTTGAIAALIVITVVATIINVSLEVVERATQAWRQNP